MFSFTPARFVTYTLVKFTWFSFTYIGIMELIFNWELLCPSGRRGYLSTSSWARTSYQNVLWELADDALRSGIDVFLHRWWCLYLYNIRRGMTSPSVLYTHFFAIFVISSRDVIIQVVAIIYELDLRALHAKFIALPLQRMWERGRNSSPLRHLSGSKNNFTF